jgi:undecaprenyl-diphosphatase
MAGCQLWQHAPYWCLVLLGGLQGLTEFLPVSSSGHLVLAQHLLGMQAPGLQLEVALHLGTVAAVAALYAADVAAMARGLVEALHGRAAPGARLLGRLAVASLPAAAVGVALSGLVEALFASPAAAALGWWATAGALLWADRRRQGTRRAEDLTLRGALRVGAWQALALLPGLSRSGATVAGALAEGLSPAEAARFSFLLSLPAVLGAVGLQLPALAGGRGVSGLWLGAAAAGVGGAVAMRSFVRALARRRMAGFACYCLALGALALAVAALRPRPIP